MALHLNDNILCVIDVETTGLEPRFHDIIEVCVLPLNNQLKVDNNVLPFSMDLIPMRKENIDLEALRIQKKVLDRENYDKVCSKKERILEKTIKGCDPYRAADLFVEWWEKLKLLPFKRIMPIAHNWAFDREFLIDWLGKETFDMCFDARYRDTMGMSLYDNDIADWNSEEHPYPKNNLSYLSSQMKVPRYKAHSALDDCIVTAEVYRKMIQSALRSCKYEQVPSEDSLPENSPHTDHK